MAQVDRDGTESGGGESEHLVPPGVPELWEPVEKDDQRTLADIGEVEARTVRRNEAMLPRAVEEDRRGVLSHRLSVAIVCWAEVIAFCGTGEAEDSAFFPTSARMAVRRSSRTATMR